MAFTVIISNFFVSGDDDDNSDDDGAIMFTPHTIGGKLSCSVNSRDSLKVTQKSLTLSLLIIL